MTRRKTSKKNAKENKRGVSIPDFRHRHSENRFKVSLIFLIAALALAVFIFLFTLIGLQNSRLAAQASPVPSPGAQAAAKTVLDDPNLDFTFKMPSQLGQWLYKTGSVKSPVDETLSNQYASVYVPRSVKAGTSNFDDLTQNILTVRQFSKKEWEKLESGCQKGNQLFCEAAGKKMGEKNGTVYAYTVPASCPADTKTKCSLAEKIVSTFTLK